MTGQGLPENDPRDDDEVTVAPDEADETDEEGAGPDVKTDTPDEPTPDVLPEADQPDA